MRIFPKWCQIFALALLVPCCIAGPIFTNSGFNVKENQPFTLQWSGVAGRVTGLSGTSFTWTPNNIPAGTYAFRIDDGVSEPGYSLSPWIGSAIVKFFLDAPADLIQNGNIIVI
ncbi:hypothetical protein B0H63DRAFT_454755 [Podospora didyma]|uniref:Uncharacterized protein n=1 Tax=Podospora didyma TaxID=330526 RepID=A0AAE0K769_9PEZI|nr:hypothetical protein B0H63DRAFT_454755 [Podospora didyma]